ncbi:MAG TPA: MXAN_2561 family MXYO-CTERM-anchored protein, partial [Myxococcaceae bacterium]|nr:MXAN_2561 family MXYO-CTERM-anchored protein [Myxococcaceae bacterium]
MFLRPVFLGAVILVGGSAVAQTQSGLTIQLNGQSSASIGADDCGGSVTVSWTISVFGTTCDDDLRLWVTRESCTGDPPSGVTPFVSENNWPTQTTGEATLKVADLPGISGTDGGTGCGTIEEDYNVCGAVDYSAGFGSACQTARATSATLSYDALPPAAPSAPTLSGIDSAITVGLSAPEDAAFMVVEYRLAEGEEGGAFRATERIEVSRGSYRIEGLVNDVSYEVRTYAVDDADNQGPPSDGVIGQPRATVGFFEAYKRAGGAETGGCGAAGGGALATLS